MSELAPSILSADFNRLGQELQCLEQSGLRILHVDVMDGSFVPSISFGMPVIASIRKESNMFFDVHLMIEEPIRYIKEFVEAGADNLTLHAESCSDIGKTVAEVRKYGIQVALSIKPETPVSSIVPYLNQLDMVLIMSVEPGFGGQKLIPETLQKVEELCRIREEQGYLFQIEIDGGVTKDNIGEIISHGVDIAVAGTAVFKGDMKANVAYLKGVLAGAS